ncbi:MAG: cytosine permease [Curvibacter sp.]|nr:cytosine permease [Curvibacter sp.]
MIMLAVMIALPAFVMGAELSFSLGARRAVWAALLGGAVLATIAGLTGATGARTRQSTYELITEAFGTQGARLVNAVLGLSLLGWYGVIAMMFAEALVGTSPVLRSMPLWQFALGGCVLTTATALFGFRALDLLSALTSPLKMVLLLWTFYAALRGGWGPVLDFAPGEHRSLGTGISIVVGGLIVGAVLAPDVARFARTSGQAAVGCAVAYGLCFPAVLLLAGMPSLAAANKDLIAIMITLGLGLPALLIVALTAWSTNTFNLYAVTLLGQTVWKHQPAWRLSLGAGLVGACLGLAGVSQLLVPYLIWLGIGIPPIAGVYLLNAMLSRRGKPVASWRVDALIAWLLGSGWAGLSTPWGLQLTPVPAVDSILVSALAYALMHRFVPRAQVAAPR